jgi:hypothetical protein
MAKINPEKIIGGIAKIWIPNYRPVLNPLKNFNQPTV